MQRVQPLTVLTTELRNYPVKPSPLESFPYFLRVTSPMTLLVNGRAKQVFKDDVIAWINDNTFRIFTPSQWEMLERRSKDA